MNKEEARLAVLSEYDRWAKKHPNEANRPSVRVCSFVARLRGVRWIALIPQNWPPSAAKLSLSRNEARRIAVNIAKLPGTAANPSGPHLTSLTPIPGTLASER
jgi:hypothetical protein